MKAWILSLIVSVGSVAGAASLPQNFDAGQWDKLQARIQKDGTPMETEMGTYMSLSHIVPTDITQAHQADYMSDVGWDVNGKYVPYQVSAVSETWSITKDGDWDIDQWIYGANIQGELKQVYHIHLVETKGGLVKDSGLLPAPAVDSAEMTEQWGKMLNPWLTGAF